MNETRGTHLCDVCGNGFSPLADAVYSDIPIFRFTDGLQVQGWSSRMSMCGVCKENHGVPVKILHRPLETDFGVFSKSSVQVEIKRSGPKDD